MPAQRPGRCQFEILEPRVLLAAHEGFAYRIDDGPTGMSSRMDDMPHEIRHAALRTAPAPNREPATAESIVQNDVLQTRNENTTLRHATLRTALAPNRDPVTAATVAQHSERQVRDVLDGLDHTANRVALSSHIVTATREPVVARLRVADDIATEAVTSPATAVVDKVRPLKAIPRARQLVQLTKPEHVRQPPLAQTLPVVADIVPQLQRTATSDNTLLEEEVETVLEEAADKKVPTQADRQPPGDEPGPPSLALPVLPLAEQHVGRSAADDADVVRMITLVPHSRQVGGPDTPAPQHALSNRLWSWSSGTHGTLSAEIPNDVVLGAGHLGPADSQDDPESQGVIQEPVNVPAACHALLSVSFGAPLMQLSLPSDGPDAPGPGGAVPIPRAAAGGRRRRRRAVASPKSGGSDRGDELTELVLGQPQLEPLVARLVDMAMSTDPHPYLPDGDSERGRLQDESSPHSEWPATAMKLGAGTLSGAVTWLALHRCQMALSANKTIRPAVPTYTGPTMGID